MSRLVDVCRQRIVFVRVADLTACVRLVCEDAEASLLRVKSRMDQCSDAAESAGYRSVSLSLCLSTPWTRKMGAASHVCEVQLVLEPFAELCVSPPSPLPPRPPAQPSIDSPPPARHYVKYSKRKRPRGHICA